MKIKCYCKVCGKFIGSFYQGLKRQTCSKKCYKVLVSKQVSGTKNPNFKHGKYFYPKKCVDCGKTIDRRSERCYKCRFAFCHPFKGKRHSKESKLLIGLKSKEKFTKEYFQNIKNRCQGLAKRAINGYILIKDYKHPNRNSHNDVLEHIKIMSYVLGRPIKKNETIHHIDMTRDNNAIDNLYLFKNISEHLKCHASINLLIKELLERKIIMFKEGKYKMKKERKIKGEA